MPNQSSTNTSLQSSSERFGLDQKDTHTILVYNHPNGGLSTTSEQDLCKTLDDDPNLRCNKIPIPWGNSSVEVQSGDLLPASQRIGLPDWPSLKLNLASIHLPRSAYWKRLLGQCKDLYVVSPESSPEQ